MSIVGPFIAQDGERRVYFNGHSFAGQKIWGVAGRDGATLIRTTRQCDRNAGVAFVKTVLSKMQDGGRIDANMIEIGRRSPFTVSSWGKRR